MDIGGLVQGMISDGAFSRIVNNPLAQFGPESRNYLGASLLPELLVPENNFTQDSIKYRVQMANAGTRYSPVQIKQGVMTGSMNVVLGNSDIGSQFTGRDYDQLIRILEKAQVGTGGGLAGTANRPAFDAMTSLLNWADATLLRPLLEFNELNRWNALINAQAIVTGDGGYTETINYPNPTGHRVAAGGTWSNNSYDPYTDIMTAQAFLANLGFRIGRIITSTPVMTKLSLNQQIRARLGLVSIAGSIGSTVAGLQGHASKDAINGLLAKDDLPPIETYDLQYRTQTGSGYFFPRTVMLLVCTTLRDMQIDLGDLQPMFADGAQGFDGVVHNVLGYTGIGRPSGQSEPGRVVHVETFMNKPPRVQGEAWQTSLPVIMEPEALYVINTIS